MAATPSNCNTRRLCKGRQYVPIQQAMLIEPKIWLIASMSNRKPWAGGNMLAMTYAQAEPSISSLLPGSRGSAPGVWRDKK
jgi:hypothetical protein